MGIERKKFETKREFELITGMIVSDAFIKEIIPVFSPKYLSSSPAKTVARWCMEYFAKYQSAPKETIQDLFKSKTREGQLEEADVEIIEKYLDNLSRKYETLTDDNYNHHRTWRWRFHKGLYRQCPGRPGIVPISSRCRRLSGYYLNQKSLNSR